MTYATIILTLALVGTILAVWLAVTWPLLQWTLAWLEKRRDRALSELDLDSLAVADDVAISPDVRLHVERERQATDPPATSGATTTVNLP